jgi:outer membrane protein, heavy metal efflux system
MKLQRFSAAVLLAGWVAQSFAQALPSLADAVESAWRRAASSTEAAGQARRAEAERAAASAPWAAPPAVEVGVTRDRQRAGGTSRESELGVAVPLWLPGQRAARLGEVEAEVSTAAATATAERLRLAGAVREAAAEVALQRAEVQAASGEARDLQALARDVERRLAAGDLARADALAANAESLAAATSLARAQQRLQAAELNWQTLTGLKQVSALLPEAAPATVAEHPALQAAARKVELARQRLQVADTSRRESPELVVRARHESATGEPGTRGLGVALRIPLGTAGRNDPLLAAALSQLELAQASERELRQRLEGEVSAARLAQQSARQQLGDQGRRAALLRERAALMEKSFKAGETALPEMLRALTAAAQAEADLARSQATLAQATSRLQQALGVMP